MPALLDEKLEAYCHKRAIGETQLDAYKAAGFKGKSDSAARKAASRLESDSKNAETIKARIRELQGIARDELGRPVDAVAKRRFLITAESICEELRGIACLAVENKQYSPAVAAYTQIAKISGAEAPIKTEGTLNVSVVNYASHDTE